MLRSSNERYKFKQKIGNGTFGEVWLVKSTTKNKKYILKKLKLHGCSEVEQRRAILESQLLSTLNHPNIVTYHDSFFEGNGRAKPPPKNCVLNIVMGYCEGGDLYEYIRSQKNNYFEESQIIEWFIQICMALQYLHDKKILHRDLKTRNIFLTRSHLIKLGDFGIARILDGTLDMAATIIGTPYYMSPEILTGKPYNHKSDIWSLGCCVYELASLRHAFKARDMNSLTFKVLHGTLPTIPSHYSKELSYLTDWMLKAEPDERPSAHCLLEHRFIHKHIVQFLEATKHRTSCVIYQQPRSQTPDERQCQKITDIKSDHHKLIAQSQLVNQMEGESQPVLINAMKQSTFKSNNIYNKPVSNQLEEQVPVITIEHRSDIEDNSKHKHLSEICPHFESALPKSDTISWSENKDNSPSLVAQPEPSEKSDRIELNTCFSDNLPVQCVSEARARRRNLQKKSASCELLEKSNPCTLTKEVNQIDSQLSQGPNTSARLRRRNRLSEDSELSKQRPKSAPTRVKKCHLGSSLAIGCHFSYVRPTLQKKADALTVTTTGSPE